MIAKRLLSAAAMVAIVSLGTASGSWAEDAAKVAAEPAAAEVSFDADDVTSFAGAFLAARTADVDRDYTTAIMLYKKALRIEPGNPEIRQRLMISLLLNGDFAEGVRYANELKADPSIERITTIVRAMDALKRGEFKTAQTILKYSGPNDLDRMTNDLLSAWAKLGAGRGREALSSVEKMKGPDWFGIFRSYNAGAIAIITGDVKSARQHLNDAILDKDGGSTAPDTFVRAVMALARLEASQGNKQKALDALAVGENALANYPPFTALRQGIEADQTQEQQVRNAAQGAAGVLFSIGAALNRDGAEDIVSLYLQTASALDSDSADTLVMLGAIAERQKLTQRAIDFYRRVPQGSPMQRISELQLGLALADSGKVDEARNHLKGLIASDPKDIRSYLAYGSVLSEAKDYAAMAENYDHAVEALGPLPNRASWSIFFQRGIAYERLKKWDQAEPNFRKALDLKPDEPQVLNYLGYSWIDMNRNLDEGLKMVQRAVELRPDDGLIIDSLGWAYFRLNRFDDAVRELERAVSNKAGDPTINDHLGDAYWRTGRTLEAVYQWNRALTYKPEEGEVAKIKDKIEKGLPPLDEAAKTADKKS